LLTGSESAVATVVGRIEEPTRIDHDGYQAWLVVEHTLQGRLPAARVRIAWEELSASRPVRFKERDRVLVALAPLPSASLWRNRFPQADAAAEVFVVAEEGDAFVVHPDRESITGLAAYLTLPSAERAGSSGSAALAFLVARGAPLLAVACASALRDSPDESPLTAAAESDLLKALQTREQPAIQALLVEIATRRRLKGLRRGLEDLGRRNPDLALPASLAVATIDGGMGDETVLALLRDADPVKRNVAVRFARGAAVEQLLPLLRSDPDPRVRAAAAVTLIDQRGSAAMAQVIAALGDPDGFVRAEAARAIGSLGAVAVEPLLAAAQCGPEPAAQAAILAIESTGAGNEALHELADHHPQASVRRLAKLALGKLDNHQH